MSKVEFKTGEVVEVSDYEDFSNLRYATFLADCSSFIGDYPEDTDVATVDYPVVVLDEYGAVNQYTYVRKVTSSKFTAQLRDGVYETTEELYNEYLDVVKRIKESK